MLLRRFPIACLSLFFACLLALLASAAPQESVDRQAYARDYVKFLVVQLEQWSKEFPHQFHLALMRPPVDSSKLSEAAKAGASELGESIQRLAALTNAKDLTTSVEFRSQLEKSLASAKELNQAMGSQRFSAGLQSDWDQIRSTLNNLARIYKVETLAFLEAPGAGEGGRGGRGGRGAAAAATANVAPVVPPGAVLGYVVDQACAKRGKGMWTNTACIERCIRDGDKIVLVTEEGKVFQISNQDKITADSYGARVIVVGKTDGDVITVDSLKAI